MQFFLALYTHQKTKKAKTWQDGFVKYNPETRTAILLSSTKDHLDKYKVPGSRSFEVGEEFDFGRFLVQLDAICNEESMNEMVKKEIDQSLENNDNIHPVKRTKNSVIGHSFTVPSMKTPVLSVPTQKVQLNDNELLDFLINPDDASAQPAIQSNMVQKRLSFADTDNGPLQRNVQIPLLFNNFALYKESFAESLWEVIQLHVTKMYREVKKYSDEPVSKSPWIIHTVIGIKESSFKVGKNEIFIERKFNIVIDDAKKQDFNKDDLWIVFDKTIANYFVAVSTFHGPNTDGEVEVKIFKEFQFCPLIRSFVSSVKKKYFAVKTDEVSSEILMYSLLKDATFSLNQLELPMINMFKKPLTVPLHGKISEFIAEIIQHFNLNEDQQNVLFDYCVSVMSDSPSFSLVHGVFGAGKSFLIAVLVIFTVRLHNEILHKECPKVLISSMTNVAVDRVLMCLLELGFDKFLRIGSLKKINKRILPYSMQSLKNDEEVRELVEILRLNPSLSSQETQQIAKSIEIFKTRENTRVLKESIIVGSTCIATTFETFSTLSFPIVILDEVSQQIEPLSLLPLRLGCKSAVLVGDPLQLSPNISFSNAREKGTGLERTLFDRMSIIDHPKRHLFIQYRCHPDICKIVNDLFYEGKIDCRYKLPTPMEMPSCNADDENFQPFASSGLNSIQSLSPISFPPLMFVNVPNGISRDFHGSLYNDSEISAIRQILLEKISAKSNLSIGIISFYKAQITKLQSSLSDIFNGQIATVDSFQVNILIS